MMALHPTFQGEVMLLNWSDSSSSGAKIVLQLPDSDDLEPFKSMTVAKGKTAGQRLAIVVVEIGDDERPVQRDDKPKGGELARLAGQLCQNPEFLQYGNYESPEEAAADIRFACQIQSRAELDHNPEAAAIFHESYRKPFIQWKGGRA